MEKQTAPSPRLSKESLSAGEQAFAKRLGVLARDIPEVAESRDSIEGGAKLIIDELGIRPELFKSYPHSLLFAALSERYGDLENRKGELSVDAYTREKEFICDAAFLLVGKKGGLYPQIKDLIDEDDNLSEQTQEKLYDKFTNRQVTKELTDAINQGLLSEVKTRLGITAENEDPFEVRVLNVGQDIIVLYGIKPTITPELQEKHYSDPAWKEHFDNADLYTKYAKGLADNTAEFLRLTGTAQLPVAWQQTVNGVNTLVLPLPFAEKILYRDEVRSESYVEDDLNRDIAVLEHEYTHTQGGLNLDNNVFFGVALEERRAELFSGDRQGYKEIKEFFTDINTVTGTDLMKYMCEHEKGGDPKELFTFLVSSWGLQATLEFVLTAPPQYIKSSRPLQKNIADYLGGPDAWTKKMYAKIIKEGKADEVNERIDKVVDRFAALPTETFDFWVSFRKGSYDLTFMTEKIEDQVALRRAA